MVPSVSPRTLLFVFTLAASAGFAACGGCGPGVSLDDAGAHSVDELPDAGADAGLFKDAGAKDASVPTAPPPPFKTGAADEPCPDGSYAFEQPDGGFPEGTVVRGICIGLSTLQATATVDGKAAQDEVHLTFSADEHRSDIDRPVTAEGKFSVRVMRSKYENLLYHPNEILNHAGAKDMGPVDMRKDQTRILPVNTWIIAGAAFFAGQPWPSSSNPPDTTVVCEGLPPQSGWDQSVNGSYEVRLMEGQFIYKVSVPLTSLGDTELFKYPVEPWVTLNEDKTIDINLQTSELSGTFTIDGQPFPNRIANGPDFRLEYIIKGDVDPTVATVHEGGGAFFSAIVPKNVYAINLDIASAADPSLPSDLYNQQFAVGVDLTGNQTASLDLKTHAIEGAIMVDGVPVTPNPAKTWILYAYAPSTMARPWFLSYYTVPFKSASFTLRALPANYYMLLLLSDAFAPDLAQGWHEISPNLEVKQDVSLPIDIPTNVVEGTLLIDGVPAASLSSPVGTLIFQAQSAYGYFRKRITTTDGTFRVRLPRGKYDVSFVIEDEAYPDYAVGTHAFGVTLDLEKPVTTVLDYRTVPVGGPLLLGGAPLPDSLAVTPEAKLVAKTVSGFVSFSMPLQGGKSWYFMRLPKDDYALSFELEKDVIEDVAYGSAPLGNNLLLRP